MEPKVQSCVRKVAVSQRAVPSHNLDQLKQFSPEAEVATQETEQTACRICGQFTAGKGTNSLRSSVEEGQDTSLLLRLDKRHTVWSYSQAVISLSISKSLLQSLAVQLGVGKRTAEAEKHHGIPGVMQRRHSLPQFLSTLLLPVHSFLSTPELPTSD